MTKNTKRILGGSAALFGLLGLSATVIGAIYPILLENAIDTEGVAFFQAAMPIYAIFLMLCSIGLPNALARAVATRAQYNDGIGVKLTFRYALITFSAVGVVLALLLFQGSDTIAQWTGLPNAAPAMRAIAPTVLFLLIVASFRGYFQGLSANAPTIYSQLLEQAFKLGIGLVLASLWSKDGPSKAATGAALGVMIGEAISLALLVLLYLLGFEQVDLDHDEVNHMTAPTPLNRVMLNVWKDGVTNMLSQGLVPICMAIDALMIVTRLTEAGFVTSVSQMAYGVFAGVVMPLAVFPSLIWKDLNTEFIPSIREQWALKQMDKLRRTVGGIYRMNFFIFVPVSIGLFVLAEPLLSMLFPQSLQGVELATATSLLRLSSVSVLAIALGISSTIALIGMRKGTLLLISTLLAALVKLALMAILLGRKSTNVQGAAFASLAAFSFWAIANTIQVLESADLAFDWLTWAAKPGAAGAAMGALAFLLYKQAFSRFLGPLPSLLLTVAISVAAYVGICVVFRATGGNPEKPVVSDRFKPNFDA